MTAQYINMIWETVISGPFDGPWFGEVVIVPNNEDAEIIVVTIDDPNKPEGEGVLRKAFDKTDIAKAYQSMDNKTHCGGDDLIRDPDACTFDLIVQQAFFGELVYC